MAKEITEINFPKSVKSSFEDYIKGLTAHRKRLLHPETANLPFQAGK